MKPIERERDNNNEKRSKNKSISKFKCKQKYFMKVVNDDLLVIRNCKEMQIVQQQQQQQSINVSDSGTSDQFG